jgi:hypothetical protein
MSLALDDQVGLMPGFPGAWLVSFMYPTFPTLLPVRLFAPQGAARETLS